MSTTRTIRCIQLWIVVLLAIILPLCACDRQRRDKPVLAVSIAPQRYLLERIAGDKYDIVTLLSANADPETYDPAINSLMGLQKSSIFFRVGTIGFEQAAIGKIAENLPDLKIINCSKGIPLITGTHGGPHGYDPHIWTSVKNARVIARNMYEAMVDFDPKNKKYFTTNYNRLDASLASLDSTISVRLAPYRGSTFVVKHPSLSYFANDYGLKQIALELNGKEPTPKQMRDRLNAIRTSDALYMFMEKGNAHSASAAQIADELDLKVKEISLLDYDWTRNMLELADTFVDGKEN